VIFFESGNLKKACKSVHPSVMRCTVSGESSYVY